MKLSVEIKDDKMNFRYKVGTSEMTGHMQLDAHRLLLFSKLLCDLQNAESNRYNSMVQEITAKAWIEKNPQAAVKFIKTRIKR